MSHARTRTRRVDGAGSPERSCVVCRRRGEPAGFLRFVASPQGAVVFDPSARAPGRGAYTCATHRCVGEAVRRRAFPRALRADVSLPESGALTEQAHRVTHRKVLELLGLMRRSGSVALGAREVCERLAEGGLELVVVAEDHSPRSAADVARSAGKAGVSLARFSTGEELGKALGRSVTGVVGAYPGRLGKALRVEVQKVNMLAPPEGAQADGEKP